jgi:hypothetical protein
VKVFIGIVAGLLAAGIAAALVYVSYFDHRDLRYGSEGALLAAMPGTAAAELTAHGVALSEPLGCWGLPEATPKKLRVACEGRSTKAHRVQVLGAAEKKTVQQFFTILVDGKPLVQNAGCLGADCHSKKA